MSEEKKPVTNKDVIKWIGLSGVAILGLVMILVYSDDKIYSEEPFDWIPTFTKDEGWMDANNLPDGEMKLADEGRLGYIVIPNDNKGTKVVIAQYEFKNPYDIMHNKMITQVTYFHEELDENGTVESFEIDSDGTRFKVNDLEFRCSIPHELKTCNVVDANE